MDGSASSQAYTDKFNLNFNGSRIMPNAILIYKLWYSLAPFFGIPFTMSTFL